MAGNTPQLSRSEQERARAAKAEAERKRRARKAALEKAGLDASMDKDLTPEQRERAEVAKDTRAGLSGPALARWILEGKNSREQVEEARAEARAAAREERARQNVTRSADPEASQLAHDAHALAPELKSTFLPKEGREFLEVFTVEELGDRKVKVSRTGAQGVEGALEVVNLDVAELRAFAVKGQKNKEMRAALSGLGKGTRLWGRKLGLMILAQRANVRKAG